MLSLALVATAEAEAASQVASSDKDAGVGPGKIVLAVTYDRSGKVSDCRLVRSNAPVDLEASTVEYIRTKWTNPFFAGMEVTLPIVFEGQPGAAHWNGDFPLPPNFFPYDNQKYAMKLRLTFDKEGWVTHVEAAQTSGIQLVDDQTGAWIQAHWHHAAYANRVVEVPLEFSRPPPPPPPAPPPVPKPKPPPEPVAIPAMRVQ
jgi:hypothetical protein